MDYLSFTHPSGRKAELAWWYWRWLNCLVNDDLSSSCSYIVSVTVGPSALCWQKMGLPTVIRNYWVSWLQVIMVRCISGTGNPATTSSGSRRPCSRARSTQSREYLRQHSTSRVVGSSRAKRTKRSRSTKKTKLRCVMFLCSVDRNNCWR